MAFLLYTFSFSFDNDTFLSPYLTHFSSLSFLNVGHRRVIRIHPAKKSIHLI